MNQAPSVLLAPFRERLESLDRRLTETVAARLEICAQVAQVKREHGIPMMQPDRVDFVKDAYAARGRELGVSEAFMRALATLLIEEACRLEDEIIEAAS